MPKLDKDMLDGFPIGDAVANAFSGDAEPLEIGQAFRQKVAEGAGKPSGFVVDPLYGKGVPEGFSDTWGPLAEEAAQGATVDDETKPEGWDDPWYWANASDETKAGATYTPAQEAVSKLGTYYLFGDSRSYHFGNAGSARVETEAIRACAASGKRTLEQIEELITSMMGYVAASEQYWQGSTGDDFRQGFLEGMKALTHDLANLSPYTRELIAYADKYDDVITESNLIAEGIGDVVWHDV